MVGIAPIDYVLDRPGARTMEEIAVRRIPMGRGFVYILTLVFMAGLAFLTVRVLLDDGPTIVVIAALVILAVLVFGALGALGGRGREGR